MLTLESIHSPNRNVSHAIQDIMSTVQRKMGTSKTLTLGSAHVPATTHISTRTCPAAAQNTSYRSSGSVATPNSGQQLSTTNGLGCSSNLRSPSLRNGQRQNLDIAVQDSRVQRPEGRRLACHVRKNDEVHGRVPSCSFKGAGAMSALRIHLTCRDHSRDLHFIRHCRNCSEYVIDESDWCNRHEGMLCTMKKQSRGDAEVVRQWRELYEKMFPDSNRIPHPCKLQAAQDSPLRITDVNTKILATAHGFQRHIRCVESATLQVPRRSIMISTSTIHRPHILPYQIPHRSYQVKQQ